MIPKTKAKPCNAYLKTVLDTTSQLCGADSNRTSITINGAGIFYVSDNPTMTEGEGFFIGLYQPTYTFCRCHHGDFVTRALFWIASSSSGPGFCFIIEGFEQWQSDTPQY